MESWIHFIGNNMKESKYRIIIDYGAYEGWSLEKEEFETVDAAVKWASRYAYNDWHVIRIIDWEAVDLTPSK